MAAVEIILEAVDSIEVGDRYVHPFGWQRTIYFRDRKGSTIGTVQAIGDTPANLGIVADHPPTGDDEKDPDPRPDLGDVVAATPVMAIVPQQLTTVQR